MTTAPVNDRTTTDADSPDGILSLGPKALWSESAPKDLRSAWSDAPDSSARWEVVVDHFRSREQRPGFAELRGAKPGPLAWGVSPCEEQFHAWLAEFESMAAAKSRSQASEGFAQEWLDEAPLRQVTPLYALETLAWGYSSATLTQKLSAATWGRLIATLTAIADDAQRVTSDLENSLPEEAWTQQLLAGELPFVLACLMPEFKPIRGYRGSARDVLSDAIVDWTDGEGLLHARLLNVAAPLLSCWTRCRTLGEGLSKGAWNAPAELQYEWLLRQSLRLVDRNGAFPFGDETPMGMVEVLRRALELSGDDSDTAAAALRLQIASPRSDDTEPPEPSNQSDWAGVAVLGSGWRDKAPRMVVVNDGVQLRIEFSNARQTLFSGDWPLAVSVGGKDLAPTEDWDCSCWYSDEDCDYLELEIELEQGARVERQFMLARNDGVALFGEMLFSESEQAQELSIESTLTLGEGIGYEGESETRDGLLLQRGKPFASVTPLSLPEWRVETHEGELRAGADHSLHLSRQATGRNLATSLWVDLSPTRFSKQRTWRRLTVAQSLERVGHDVAVGYRVQSGKQQWLIYRSLDEPANRTVLGQNLASEALVGRFLSSGEVDEYFEIEGDE